MSFPLLVSCFLHLVLSLWGKRKSTLARNSSAPLLSYTPSLLSLPHSVLSKIQFTLTPSLLMMIPLLLPPHIFALASLYPLHHSLVPSLVCYLLLTSCHPPYNFSFCGLFILQVHYSLPNFNYTLVLSLSCSHCLSFPLSPLLCCPPNLLSHA